MTRTARCPKCFEPTPCLKCVEVEQERELTLPVTVQAAGLVLAIVGPVVAALVLL